MIKLLVDALQASGIDVGFLRLANYLTFRIIMAMATPLVLSLLFGFRFIVFLYRRNLRDTSGDIEAVSAFGKRGTPTAGGLLVLFTTGLSLLLWADPTSPFMWWLSGGFFYMGFVGFLDDVQKVRFKSSLSGLSQLGKTLLLLLFVLPFAVMLVSGSSPLPDHLRTLVYLPFLKNPVLNLHPVVYVGFTVFAVFAIINAVNITDGLDGLLGGTAILTIGVYVVFAYVVGNAVYSQYLLFPTIPGAGEIAVFGSAMIGALFGFLWFNTYPAEVFLGDTGSLAIGGGLAMMAFFTKQEMLFPVAGGIFVFEVFTSLMQQKIGGRLGRRILHRAPFHHELTHRGIAEPKVVVRLVIVSTLLALMALLSLKVR